MEYSDWELVREIKNGNEDAMELLVRRYYPQVFRYVLQIIESEQDSYDVTQDIFLSVIQNIRGYLPLKNSGRGCLLLHTTSVWTISKRTIPTAL